MKNLEVYEPKTQSGIGHVMSSSDTPNPSTTRITTLEICPEKVGTKIVPQKIERPCRKPTQFKFRHKEHQDISGVVRIKCMVLPNYSRLNDPPANSRKVRFE